MIYLHSFVLNNVRNHAYFRSTEDMEDESWIKTFDNLFMINAIINIRTPLINELNRKLNQLQVKVNYNNYDLRL
jgi:hypothetical protein